MIAVGGMVPDLKFTWQPRDPWPQGLGIFDLTEMQWRENYNANADAYETPRMVKDGMAKEGMYPKKWDSQEVAKWLTGKCMWFSSLIFPPSFSFLAHISETHQPLPTQLEQRIHRAVALELGIAALELRVAALEPEAAKRASSPAES